MPEKVSTVSFAIDNNSKSSRKLREYIDEICLDLRIGDRLESSTGDTILKVVGERHLYQLMTREGEVIYSSGDSDIRLCADETLRAVALELPAALQRFADAKQAGAQENWAALDRLKAGDARAKLAEASLS